MKALRHLLPILASLALATVASAEIRPVSTVALGSAIRDAAKLVERHPDMKVLRVEGVSMLPYFGDGSVLVVKLAPSATLRPGMVVVYTNRFNETVAHRIIGGDAAEGWIVRGYNNAAADTTRVNDTNLIGTVYATLFAMDNRTAANPSDDDILPKGTPVAMAAPAK